MHLTRKIFRRIFGSIGICCCLFGYAYAETVRFEPGGYALYTISEEISLFIERDKEFRFIESKGEIDLEIKILSGSDSPAFSLEVEVVLRKSLYEEIRKCGKKTVLIEYDSESPMHSRDAGTSVLSRNLDRLIGRPFRFKIHDLYIESSDDEAFEEGGATDTPSYIGIFGMNPWSIKFLLKQIFSLSGKEVRPGDRYPFDYSQVLNWGFEADDENENEGEEKTGRQRIADYRSSVYSIDSVTKNRIVATINGESLLSDPVGGEGLVIAEGFAAWDPNDPLIQERTVKCKGRENFTVDDCSNRHSRFVVKQRWSSVSLSP